MNLNKLVITEICEVMCVHSIKGCDSRMENRKCSGLSFCNDGEIVYVHGDKKIKSDKTCAVIFPIGETYEIQRKKTGRFPVINFRCNGYLPNEFMTFPIKSSVSLMENFNSLRNSYQNGEILKALSVLYKMLYYINDNRTDNQISAVAEYINDNYNNPSITNTSLARINNISEVYLRTLFLKYYGVTPHKYLMEKRLKSAENMLQDSNKSVSEIASDCGYMSVYHFCRAFKERFKMSPTDYRRNVENYKL